MVFETLVSKKLNHLTRLIARGNFTMFVTSNCARVAVTEESF